MTSLDLVVSVHWSPGPLLLLVEAAVDVVLPVALVGQHVPPEAGGAGVPGAGPVGALVVHVALVRVGKVTLRARTLELGLGGGQALFDVVGGVPVVPGDLVERQQRGGLLPTLRQRLEILKLK